MSHTSQNSLSFELIILLAISRCNQFVMRETATEVLLAVNLTTTQLAQSDTRRKPQGRYHGVDWGGHVHPTFSRGCLWD